DANSSVSVSWNDTDELCTVTGVNSGNDVDRVTTFVYNGNGSLLKLVAHNSVTGDQVTEYAYGVSTSSAGVGGTYSVQSAITSNDLLLSAKYPTGSGGSSDAARTVFYGYNRLGEITQLLDQNDTIHSYTRDKSGRVTKDLALTSSSTLDTYMDRVDVAFDSAGRLSRVTGLKDGTTPVTRNEVEFKYTPLWQIEKIYQHSKGAVSYDGFGAPKGDTRLVAYSYSASAATGTGAGGNYSRVSSLAYPHRANSSGVTAEALDYSYAPSGGSGGSAPIDDIISRVHRLRTNVSSSSQVDLAIYSYLGRGTPVVVDYAPPDVQLDRTLSLNGKRRSAGQTDQVAGYYPGFDRFGRLALQIWADGALDTQWISSGLGGAYYPTKPEIVALEYGYDLNGNRTSAYDLRQGNAWPMNHRYSYDGLNRLTMAERNARSEFVFSAPTEAPGPCQCL
ncbi:MAG: hypothetical protein KF724_13840, partial [Phycisphaeraceae bacterium]|nr:hypothetical protein [Phycisphaeraceae bacterium]